MSDCKWQRSQCREQYHHTFIQKNERRHCKAICTGCILASPMGLSITDSVPNYCALGTEPERDLLKNGVSGQEWVLLEVVTPLNL